MADLYGLPYCLEASTGCPGYADTKKCWANSGRMRCRTAVPEDPHHVGLCDEHLEELRAGEHAVKEVPAADLESELAPSTIPAAYAAAVAMGWYGG